MPTVVLVEGQIVPMNTSDSNILLVIVGAERPAIELTLEMMRFTLVTTTSFTALYSIVSFRNKD